MREKQTYSAEAIRKLSREPIEAKAESLRREMFLQAVRDLPGHLAKLDGASLSNAKRIRIIYNFEITV